MENTAQQTVGRDDVYVWTARKDGTGKPVAFAGPMTDAQAVQTIRTYSGSLADVVIYCAPGEDEQYVREAILTWTRENGR